MANTHINRLRCVVTNTPGTSGNFVVGAAPAGRRGFSAAEDGKTFELIISEGNAWEVRTGCVYTHSTTTLTRGTLADSSTGSAINFTAAAVVSLGLTAKAMTDLEPARTLSALSAAAIGASPAMETTPTAVGVAAPMTQCTAQSKLGSVQRLVRRTNKTSYLWRDPWASGTYPDSWWVYVPVDDLGGHAVFGVGSFGNTGAVAALTRMHYGKPGAWVRHDAGSTVKVGAWTTRTGDDMQPDGASVCYSTTAGDSITFVGSGHTIVARGYTTTNGGYAVVAIDGDYTAANRLRTFSSGDYAAGRCRAGDVGKRYLLLSSNAAWNDVHIPIAEGLSDGSHTVRIEACGTYPTGWGSGGRTYIGGLIYCSAADVGQALGATRVMARVEAVMDFGGTARSAFTPVLATENAASNAYEFIGDVHSAEVLVSAAVLVDGVDRSAATKATHYGGASVVLTVKSTVASTDAPATPVMEKSISYVFAAGGLAPLVVRWRYKWLVAKRVTTGYGAMLPFGVQLEGCGSLAQPYTNGRWDALRLGQEYTAAPADLNGTTAQGIGKVPSYEAVIASSQHARAAYAVLLDGGQSVDQFAASAPDFCFYNTSAANAKKVYWVHSHQSCPQSYSVGDVLAGVIGYGVAAVPGAAL